MYLNAKGLFSQKKTLGRKLKGNQNYCNGHSKKKKTDYDENFRNTVTRNNKVIRRQMFKMLETFEI